MLYISEKDIKAVYNMAQCLDDTTAAFEALHEEKAWAPIRAVNTTPAGNTLFMPSHYEAADGNFHIGCKIVSVRRGNPSNHQLPAILGNFMLLDEETGKMLAIMPAGAITALRTGAIAGIGARLFANPNPEVVSLIGCGVQGRSGLEAIFAAIDTSSIKKMYLLDLFEGSTAATKKYIEEELKFTGEIVCVSTEDKEAVHAAVHASDMIHCASSGTDPVIPADAVRPGTHISSVGSYRPDMAEVPAVLLPRMRVVADITEGVLEEAGDIIQPLKAGKVTEDIILAEVGDKEGRKTVRTNKDDITFFKSVGCAVQDVCVGRAIYEAVVKAGLGFNIPE